LWYGHELEASRQPLRLFCLRQQGERIQTLRKDNSLTQSKLAEKIELSVPQLVRYETKGVQPPADVLSRLANVFGTSIDYLVNGTIQNKAEEAIDDNLLLKQFKAVEQMKKEDKNVVTKLIDAFILKANLQQQLS
jgi:transcriptional regulator with XRE-family HTH domain